MNLSHAFEDRTIVVCVGSGGVGKTTTSAAIALRAAQEGAKVCVLTIDPARRLANALGLKELGNEETRIDISGFSAQGELYAMMLDTKRTWDDLVAKYAPSQEAADRIYANSFYKQLSSALTGSHEYMAMEKVNELHEEGQYDLLVVDTPPTKHALDFLDAPQKMINLMDENVLKWFLKPGREGTRFGLKMLGSGGAWVLKLLERITGLELLKDLSEFFESFGGMYGGFVGRAESVQSLMAAEETTFVLVTSPNPQTLEEAGFFYDKLEEYELPFGGFVVNKVHRDYGHAALKMKADDVIELLGAEKSASRDRKVARSVAKRLVANLDDQQVLARVDREQIARLASERGKKDYPLVSVPYLDEDVHDLEGLDEIGQYLFGPRDEAASAAKTS